MRLFVSYARVDKPYCVQIVEVLDFHDVWFDQRLYAGQRWWKEILNRLEWCEGFIYLLSNDSLQSEYCQREFELAQSLGKDIFPVIIDPDITVPDTINHIQCADFSSGLSVDAVRDLMRAIYLAEQANHQQPAEPPDKLLPPEPLDVDAINQLISEAAQAMERGEYDRATMLLNQVLAHDYRPRFINIETWAREAEAALERQMLQRQMEREYRQIVELVHLPATRQVGLDAFRAFHKDFPSYNPENITAIAFPPKPAHTIDWLAKANERTRRIPLLEWCEIPAGEVLVGDKVKQIDAFLMARYPVTNKQYHAFLNAPHGYARHEWWDYAAEASDWHIRNPQARASKFQGANRPRENVNWYDAYAFCLWLSDLLKMEITLPTLPQRQRAIIADDERFYPWGTMFDPSRCNSRESGLRITTEVHRYPNGVNQYGVFDMAGNVWEWCLDRVALEDPPADLGEGRVMEKAIVHGGAFVSPHNRCHVEAFYTAPLLTMFSTIGFRIICVR